ncbi:hypothetical protein N9B72_00785, partial [Bacteriovoracaceae bacterium]|nr:hypothetical protein [Bacteriovoracaceae bacterium]
MKYLILTLFSITASAQNLVEFKFSKPHGVFEFFKATSNIVNSNKLLLKVYNDSKLKNKENNKLIESNKEILKYLPTNFSFKSNTKRRASGRSLLDQFTIQSILSKDIEDFRSRTMGLVPVEIHKNFFERLSELEIIYEKLIWTENIAKMQLYQRGIEQFANKAKFDRLFKSSINFYKGNWPSNTPFIIGLHPIPISKGATLAQSLGSVESVGVLINANDFADRVGVIFHEICHSIYASQSEEFKLYLEGLFSKNKSIYAPFAYQYFNEAMATAIGNGLAYSQAAGNMDTGEWYENDYINKYSKALFEKVRIYFNSQRTIDRYLVDHSIKQFEKIFPKAHLDIENLLAEFT